MYTLLLIVIGVSHVGTGPGDNVAATHFTVANQKECDQTARMLAAQSNRDLVVKAYCVPRS